MLHQIATDQTGSLPHQDRRQATRCGPCLRRRCRRVGTARQARLCQLVRWSGQSPAGPSRSSSWTLVSAPTRSPLDNTSKACLVLPHVAGRMPNSTPNQGEFPMDEIRYDRRRLFSAWAMAIAATQVGVIGSARAQSSAPKAPAALVTKAAATFAHDEADRRRPAEYRLRGSRPRQWARGVASAWLALRHPQLRRCRAASRIAAATA